MVTLLTRRRTSTLWLACVLLLASFASGRRAPVPFGTALEAQSAGPAPGLYELVAMHSGKCLDVYGASTDDAARVIQWPCHGGENQHWRVAPTGDGYFNLIANHS